jgi:hypothetical protein
MTWNGVGVGTSSDVFAGRVAEVALGRFSEAGSTFSPLVFKLQSVSA